MPSPPDNRFDRDTAVTHAGEGRFEARVDPGWWIVAGPNGGYVAAIVQRALQLAVADPERPPRSLTLHFVAPPAAGAVQIETRVERRGRSLTTVTGRMSQDGRLLCLAVAAFSRAREGIAFDHARMPEVAPPEECERMQPRIPIHERYEHRWAVGPPPFAGGDQALCGGWIRLAEPRAADACLVTAYTDAFPPAVFSLASEGAITRGVPTIDLTIHFRETLPLAGAAHDDFTFAVFRSRRAREGFVEEDGELWSRSGLLLAQSRQLALVL